MTEQFEKKRIDLKTSQVAAGSLASVTSAVAASQLGVTGTLVGAGVGSVVGTVAGAVYQHYLDQTHQHVRTVVPRIATRASVPGEAPAGTSTAGEAPTAVDVLAARDIPAAAEASETGERPAHQGPVAGEVEAAQERPAAEPATSAPKPGTQPVWSWLRSRRVALALSAAAGLGIAIVMLTGFEVFTGQPVGAHSDGGGTSIGRVFGSGAESEPAPTPSDDPTTDEPTSAPTPMTEASPSPTATNPVPSPQPSSTSASPTTEPIPEPTQPN